MRRNAKESYAKGLPMSMFTKLPALANTIDADWRFNEEVYQPGGADVGVTDNELFDSRL